MGNYDRDWGFTCEHCGQTVGGDFGGAEDFYESLALKKSEGWISRKIDGEWFDFCSEECYKDYIKVYGPKTKILNKRKTTPHR